MPSGYPLDEILHLLSMIFSATLHGYGNTQPRTTATMRAVCFNDCRWPTTRQLSQLWIGLFSERLKDWKAANSWNCFLVMTSGIVSWYSDSMWCYVMICDDTVGGKNRAPLAACDASNPRAPRLILKGCNAAEEKEVEWTKSCTTWRPPKTNAAEEKEVEWTKSCTTWRRPKTNIEGLQRCWRKRSWMDKILHHLKTPQNQHWRVATLLKKKKLNGQNPAPPEDAPKPTLKGCNAAEEKEVEWTKSCTTWRRPKTNIEGLQRCWRKRSWMDKILHHLKTPQNQHWRVATLLKKKKLSGQNPAPPEDAPKPTLIRGVRGSQCLSVTAMCEYWCRISSIHSMWCYVMI